MGNVEKVRVIPTPSNPHGLDPMQHVSIATALKQAGYATGMSGKWHLGINGNSKGDPDHQFTPNAHGYETYLGSPYTNAPMCEMDSDGVSQLHKSGPSFCFLTANDTVVQQPLRLENFTKTITDHAVAFLDQQGSRSKSALATGSPPQPWYFFMSYFHVHTPLFVNRLNRGRSKGGEFGDNVEELDDSVGELLAALDRNGFRNDTLVFMTSDNGPYQEEGWDKAGRTNVYHETTGELLGRLKGGKGQLFEGGVRMPGSIRWPAVIPAGSVSETLVSTMDIFPTVLELAGVDLGPKYVVDGRSMMPVLKGETTSSQHDVFLHYCGFNIYAARVVGRFKVFWATPKWYTNDKPDASICHQCCNGVNPWSKLTGSSATELCGCKDSDMDVQSPPLVYDMLKDPMELQPLSEDTWPSDVKLSMTEAISRAEKRKEQMLADFNPKPTMGGAGTCTSGLPAPTRQPCCPGCKGFGFPFPTCKMGGFFGKKCECGQSASDSLEIV